MHGLTHLTNRLCATGSEQEQLCWPACALVRPQAWLDAGWRSSVRRCLHSRWALQPVGEAWALRWEEGRSAIVSLPRSTATLWSLWRLEPWECRILQLPEAKACRFSRPTTDSWSRTSLGTRGCSTFR